MKRHIIAVGGGGFSEATDRFLLDRYILAQTRKKKPKVCFVPTASADSSDYTMKFYQAYAQLDCTPSHLSLFNAPTADVRSFLLEKDVIYVGGGNTKNLLALWKEWGLDKAMREAWNSGIVLTGVSAGSLCWFEHGITDSIPGDLTPISCLGFIKGSNCPHYDGEKDRRPSYHHWIDKAKIKAGMAADDGVGLHYIGTKLSKIVSSRPNAMAYHVKLSKAGVTETPHKPMYLG